MTRDFRSSAVFVAMCREQLRSMMAGTSGTESAAVVTGDGFEISSLLRPDVSGNRIAAMTSSLHALALAAGNELRLGPNRSVLIESEGGTLLVLRIPSKQSEMLLSVVCGSSGLLGSVLFAARECAQAIAEKMAGYA